MGKQGPCCHCGTTSTPLWRNGPPGKPVLCNACGSRWRTKGTLTNYTPIHARAFSSLDSDDSLNSQEEKLSFKTNRKNWHLKVHNGSSMEDEDLFAAYNPCLTGFEDDTSNKSSSGSAISVSESYVQLGSTDGNDISGPLQSSVFDFHIPSKKRSRIIRHSPASPVERLRRDLLNILQEQESSHQSGTSEEELIFEREYSAYSFEMGLGSVLLKPPVSLTEDESEASSPIIETKALHLDESAGLNWDTEDINELEGNLKKQTAFTNKYMGNTNLRDPDISMSMTCSPQICAAPNTINNERFIHGTEISSCSSHLVGGEISLPAKRPPQLTYFQTYGGMSFDIIRTCKRQKEHSAVTQCPSSSTRCLSVFCQSISSNILSSVNADQLKPPDLDVQLGVSSDVFCSLEGLSYTESKGGMNVDEQTKPIAIMLNCTHLFVPDKNPIH